MQRAEQERVLVLAPTTADAALSTTILAEAGLACQTCSGIEELVQEIQAGAGAVLLTEDGISTDEADLLIQVVSDQPHWSDLPIIMLSSSGADSQTAVWAIDKLGNVTVLEQPVRVTTLVSGLQTALRARRRQYQLRDQMQAEALLAAVVQSSEDAIVSKTLEGIITSWNAGAERLFGYAPQEAIGKSIMLIIPPDRVHEEHDILARITRGDRLEHMETVRMAKGGRLIDVSVTISAVRDATGRIIGASKVARDITAQRYAAELLRDSEARFRFLSETIPSIVWTAAPDGTITYVNRRWIEYCGLREDYGAQDLHEAVLHPEDRERWHKAWKWHLEQGRDFEIEVRNRRHDGVYRWFVVRAVPFRDEAGTIQSWFGVTTDMHEQKDLEEALRQADRRKDEFLATLAHELRNPLAPIRNALHIMRLKSDDPPTLDQARRIMERQLGQMVRLVDDLLDVGRITRGKLELRKERIDLASIVKNAVDTTLPLIEAAGHKLSITLPQQPVHLDADPVRVAQVLSNLLNNAAKYMDRGGHVWLTAVRDGDYVLITVRDKGIGIPPEALPSVFEMFTQVDVSLERSRGGLGIGLTLAKQLTELHGGTIAARSDGVGCGAEFSVRLPVTAQVGAERFMRNEARNKQALRRHRILIADDNNDALESMGTMLRLMGNEVRTALDGVEAVEEAARFQPDVIVLDIGMPRMNGYDTARRIREQRWSADTILVALTGWGQEEDKRRATAAGFDLHFTKPVSPADFEKLMADLKADYRGAQRAAGHRNKKAPA